jgi:outer membrane PBP1 activator LpoA protein
MIPDPDRHGTPRMPLRSHLLACLSLCLLLSACASVRTVTGPGPGGPDGPLDPLPPRGAVGVDSFPPAERDGYRPPARLAVLLPATGNLATAGSAVRDGLLAAYYGETRRRPQVTFYDTAGTPSGAIAALDKALAAGEQLVLGPLSRDEVGAIFARGAPPVPVIALNRGPSPPTRGSASFALAPDDEGIAAAERLVQRGAKRVLVFAQRDDNSQRSVAALRLRLRDLGGEIVGGHGVEEASPELASRVAQAVAAASPDGIFIALKAAQARAVVTALRGTPATAAPRVATSLVLNGASASKDTALDGTEYPELPWLLGAGGGLPPPSAINLGSAKGPSQRLFAFGADAWALVAWYEKLWTDPGFSLGGATGRLFIDNRGQVQHAPAWAEFSGGRPRLGARLPELPPGR